jgi:hypothetical protein
MLTATAVLIRPIIQVGVSYGTDGNMLLLINARACTQHKILYMMDEPLGCMMGRNDVWLRLHVGGLVETIWYSPWITLSTSFRKTELCNKIMPSTSRINPTRFYPALHAKWGEWMGGGLIFKWMVFMWTILFAQLYPGVSCAHILLL